MSVFTISNLIINLVLAFGLKYLWNMVNLLQFVIFMRTWQILIPAETDIFLASLKSLALFEFLPTDEIIETLKEWVGIQSDPKEDQSESAVNQLAMVIIFALVIFLLLLVLLVALIFASRSPRAKKFFDSLKQKLFYRSFIRYLLLSSLKTQMVMGSGIAIGSLIEATVLKPEKDLSFIIVASFMLFLLNAAVVLIAVALYRNRTNLNHPNVKSQIGALYELHDSERPFVGTYSVAFLGRRSFFVAVTFLLYNHPGIQIEIMLYSTLLYMSYICNVRFHESLLQQRVELFNEWILVCLCYHFVIFADSTWEPRLRDYVGQSTIGFVSFLLAANVCIIVMANIKAVIFKVKVKLTDKKKKLLAILKAKEIEFKKMLAQEAAA